MTYTQREYSTQDGDPIFRLRFAQGNAVYSYTTETAIVSDSNYTYEPAPIRFSSVNQTNEMAKDPVKLEFPRDNTFAQLFLGGVPEQVTSVTIFRGHAGDTDEEFQFYWKGRVAGSSSTGDSVSLDCENIFTSMRRTGVRARYKKKCRHALYQRGCGLNDYDFAVVVEANDITGKVVTVESLNDSNTDSNIAGDGYFTGGMLETNDGFLRYIISHSGSQLTLISALPALATDIIDSSGSSTVTIYPGCDHTRATCSGKFNNLDNFGGFPFIPGKNPFANQITGSII